MRLLAWSATAALATLVTLAACSGDDDDVVPGPDSGADAGRDASATDSGHTSNAAKGARIWARRFASAQSAAVICMISGVWDAPSSVGERV